MSAAVYRTDLSWPAIAAYELGLGAEQFRFPTYEWPAGPGGLPLDLERFARAFERRFGDRLDWEIVAAGLWTRNYMDRVEDFWERGDGAATPPSGNPFHNMAVYAWDVLDPQLLTARSSPADSAAGRDQVLSQLVEHHQDRAAGPCCSGDRAHGGDGAGRRDRDEQGQRGHRDARRHPGVQQRARFRGLPRAVWTPEGYADLTPDERLVAKRGARCSAPARSPRTGRTSSNASAGSRPSTW